MYHNSLNDHCKFPHFSAPPTATIITMTCKIYTKKPNHLTWGKEEENNKPMLYVLVSEKKGKNHCSTHIIHSCSQSYNDANTEEKTLTIGWPWAVLSRERGSWKRNNWISKTQINENINIYYTSNPNPKLSLVGIAYHLLKNENSAVSLDLQRRSCQNEQSEAEQDKRTAWLLRKSESEKKRWRVTSILISESLPVAEEDTSLQRLKGV